MVRRKPWVRPPPKALLYSNNFLGYHSGMADYTKEEQTLVIRYISGELTEVQFNFWVASKGLDKEKMADLVRATKLVTVNVPRLLGFLLLLLLAATAFFLAALLRI